MILSILRPLMKTHLKLEVVASHQVKREIRLVNTAVHSASIEGSASFAGCGEGEESDTMTPAKMIAVGHAADRLVHVCCFQALIGAEKSRWCWARMRAWAWKRRDMDLCKD